MYVSTPSRLTGLGASERQLCALERRLRRVDEGVDEVDKGLMKTQRRVLYNAFDMLGDERDDI